MKILAVCQYYYPENFQITEICEQLAANGHKVTVLTGLPNYPSGIVPPEYRGGKCRDEVINNVRVLRCFEIGRKNGGALYLGLNYLSFTLSSLWATRRLAKDFDRVFVYQLSPVLMGLAGLKYARKRGTPLMLYCCDIWPESLKMHLKNESNPLFRLMKRISRKIYASADRIAVQSESFIDYLHKVHAIPTDKISYMPAFADENYLNSDFSPNNEIVDFVFLGNIGIAQNLKAVIAAVDLIRDTTNFKLHLVGAGSALDEVKAEVEQRDLGQVVQFYGRRPVEEMPEFYKLADACLVSLKSDNQTGLTLPAKVQGYMAAGKAIIGMIDGSARKVIEEAQCGLCVAADDSEALAAAMKDFIEHPENYKNCGENGRAYFKEHFRKEVFIDTLEQELKNLV